MVDTQDRKHCQCTNDLTTKGQTGLLQKHKQCEYKRQHVSSKNYHPLIGDSWENNPGWCLIQWSQNSNYKCNPETQRNMPKFLSGDHKTEMIFKKQFFVWK